MKQCFLLLSGLFTVVSLSQAQTIAQWTFEGTAITAGSAASYTYGSPEIGSGSASGVHASSSAAWSSPVGDGSTHSFSANNWAVGDYWQFQTSTLGFNGIQLGWDQISSGTGPRDFRLQYSTDGSSFTAFGSDYTVLVNGSPNTWTSGSYSPASHYTVDLSSVSALDNASTVYFRLVDDSTVSANGNTVASSGTDRVDNFTVALAPEPAAAALAALGLVVLGVFRRRG